MAEVADIIAGIGDLPADEGIGSVFVAFGLGILALGMMYAVLLIMNYVHDKKEKEKKEQDKNLNDTDGINEADAENNITADGDNGVSE